MSKDKPDISPEFTASEDILLKKNSWVLYILECADKSLYTGITNRLLHRIQAHQAGTGARYTRSRLPVKLVYVEACIDRSHASKREYEVKKLNKRQKMGLFAADSLTTGGFAG
ncbi:MAG: GIY-YIG nuclease family protein [Fibrobacter sp.]|nr:GIY-YIG nuclease family protein [Fibrobacter sp.]